MPGDTGMRTGLDRLSLGYNRTTNPAFQEVHHEKVWAEPMPQVARAYGLATAALAKMCRKLKVPVPGRAYWCTAKLGLPVEPEPLPPLEDIEDRPSSSSKPERPARQQKQLTEAERKIADDQKEENRIVVPEQLTDPHPLVEKTQRSLASAKADSNGLVKPKARGCLDVCMGPDSIDRAMRIMDALLKALEARGYVVTTSNKKDKEGETRVLVSDESIRFSLVELLDRREKELTAAERREREKDIHHLFWSSTPEYIRFPNGRFRLSIDNYSGSLRHRWSDCSTDRLEDRLNRFTVAVIRIAEDTKRSRLEAEERQRIWEEGAPERERLQKEQERQRREEEQRKRAEEWRAKTLEARLLEWQHAQQLRAFIAAVRAEAMRRDGQIRDGTEAAQWLTWAEGYAAQHDPIAAGHELPTYSPDEETRRKLEWSSQWGGYSSGYACSPPGQPR